MLTLNGIRTKITQYAIGDGVDSKFMNGTNIFNYNLDLLLHRKKDCTALVARWSMLNAFTILHRYIRSLRLLRIRYKYIRILERELLSPK